jgi:hypothetical protein
MAQQDLRAVPGSGPRFVRELVQGTKMAVAHSLTKVVIDQNVGRGLASKVLRDLTF